MLNRLDYNILYTLKDFETVSANEIAEQNLLSIGTIRREIKIINPEIAAHGLQIRSESSKGFILIMNDPEKGRSFIDTVIYHVERHPYADQENDYITYYLIRQLLIRSEYASIERMCLDIGYSKSTVIKHLPQVRNYLSAYDLKLVTVRNKGAVIEGREWDKRMCMIAQVRYHLSLPKELREKEDSFRQISFGSSSLQDQMQKVIVSVLSKYDQIVVPFLLLRKICHLISICDSRHHLNEDCIFPEEIIRKVKDSIEYNAAEDIYLHVSSFIRNAYTEKEVIMLAFFLAAFRSIFTVDQIPEDDRSAYCTEAETVLKYIQKHTYMTPAVNEKNISLLACFLYGFHFRVILNIEMEEEILAIYKTRNPYILDVCRCFAKYYLKEKDLWISEDNIISAYPVFSAIINYHHSLIPPINIVISSIYGSDYENLVIRRIENRYQKIIASIGHLPGNNQVSENCDLFLSDYDPAKYKVSYPDTAVHAKMSVTDWNIDEAIADYKTHFFNNALRSFFNGSCIENSAFESKDEFFTAVCEEHPDTDGSKLLEDMKHNDSLLSSERINGIACIRYPAHKKEPFLKVYLNEKEFLWNISNVSIIILYSYGEGYHNFYAVNEFIKGMMRYGKRYLKQYL